MDHRDNCLTHSMEGQASSFAIISQIPSRLSARFQHLSQELIETSPANKYLGKKKHSRYFSLRIVNIFELQLPITNLINRLFNVYIIVQRSRWCSLSFFGSKVGSRDREGSKQWERNFLLVSADVRGGGRLNRELKQRRFRAADVNRKFMFLLLARFHARPVSYKALILAFKT